jgi:predicted nucleic acid-binding protein
LIFIDTTAWVAGIDASDPLHDDGKAIIEALAEGRSAPALTTDFVLDETLTLLKRRGARVSKAAEALEQLLSSPSVTVVYVDESLFEESLVHFKKYEKLSFTDAVTLTIMQRYGIKEIYSHDSDFDLKGIVRKERP